MNDAISTLYIRHSDSRTGWSLSTSQDFDTASLGVVSIPVLGGALFVDTGITRTTSRLDIFIQLDDAEVPTWIDELFGEKCANQVIEHLDSTASSNFEITPDLTGIESRRLQHLRRFAEGLWMRRFWPASRLHSPAIPVFDTRLLDLELIEIALDSHMRTLMSESPILDQLVGLRLEFAMHLGEHIGRVDKRYRQRVSSAVCALLSYVADTMGEDDDLSTDDERVYARAVRALDSLDSTQDQVPERSKEHDELAEVIAFLPLVDESSECDSFDDMEVLALTAGPVHDSGQSPRHSSIDWSLNVHCLFDPDGDIEWSAESDETGVTVSIRAQLYDPEAAIVDEPTAYVYWGDLPIPVFAPMTPDDNGSDQNFLSASIRVPSSQALHVEVCSGGIVPKPKSLKTRRRVSVEQRQALVWAADRLRHVRTPSGSASTTGDPEHRTLWLAEMVAVNTPRAHRISADDGAGLLQRASSPIAD